MTARSLLAAPIWGVFPVPVLEVLEVWPGPSRITSVIPVAAAAGSSPDKRGIFKEAACADPRKQLQPTHRQVGTLVQFFDPSLVQHQGWSRVPDPGLVLSLGAKVDCLQAVPWEG